MNWQPIETAPNGFGYMLLYRTGLSIFIGRRGGVREAGKWVDEEGWARHPTHWMPLPDPPSQERT